MICRIPMGVATWATLFTAASLAQAPLPPQAPGEPPVLSSSGVPLTLAEAVEAAWRRAAVSVDVDGQRRKALAERSAASAMWPAPPAIEAGFNQDRQRPARPSRETELGLSVPLWLPGQRAARSAVVDADEATAAGSAAAARLRVAGPVREAMAEVALQRAVLAAAQAQAGERQLLAEDVARRVAAGDLARADALAARADHLDAAGELNLARQGLQSALLRWRALTGLADIPAPQTSALAPPPLHPDLQAAQLKVQAARLRVRLVGVSQRDAPELVVRARQERAPSERNTNGVGVSLRIPFGTDARNDALMASALAERDLAEATEQELRQQLEAGQAVAQLAEASARQQLVDEIARHQLLRERAALIEKAFKAGEMALPEMLRALSAASQAQAAAARAQATLARATSRLHQAQGILP